MSEEVNRERLVQFLANVDQEIANMCSGEGQHRPGTLHFELGKNSAPVMNRLEILKEAPTQKNLDQFLELAAQDFGAATADFFRGQSQAIFTPDPSKAAKPVPKAFDVAIKDAFYDMFRTARIAMEPKQVERIEAISLNLAGVIESKIATAVGFAVGNTVREQLGFGALRADGATEPVPSLKEEKATAEAKKRVTELEKENVELRSAANSFVDAVQTAEAELEEAQAAEPPVVTEEIKH
ncbi:hypothetical protein LCGC14_0209140 [marine sediment metagenome]|uniref:Uncharacterized protein n=1 Tax=marine sediment metagenome TaxID=412755 RepID=A0A0F9XK31_9ZZZZ